MQLMMIICAQWRIGWRCWYHEVINNKPRGTFAIREITSQAEPQLVLYIHVHVQGISLYVLRTG